MPKLFAKIVLLSMCLIVSVNGEEAANAASELSTARLKLMRDTAVGFEFSGGEDVPKTVETEPLFRYDDPTRGYEDGTVWRLGKSGRPLAIITTELHPRYGYHGTNSSNPRMVYDLLSLSPKPLRSRSKDLIWTPQTSAVNMKALAVDVVVADTPARRMLQMKQIARRFTGVQEVSDPGLDERQLALRLLPQNIDRYQSGESPNSDGAIFLFVAGRMPGFILVLETDGTNWEFGAGRLSGPSTLALSFDNEEVWAVKPDNGGVRSSHFATNAPAVLPQEK